MPGVGAHVNRYTFPQPSGMARHSPGPLAWPDVSPAQRHGQTFPRPTGMARHFPQPSGMARRFPSSAAWPDVSPAQWHGQTFPQLSGMARHFPGPVAWPDVSPTSRRRAGRVERQDVHSPCLTFRHLPPNSATIGYATKGLYSLSPSSCPPTLSATTERFGY